MDKKYVIVDIHPEDAWFDERHNIVGKVVTNLTNIEDNPWVPGYVAGEVHFTHLISTDTWGDINLAYFHAVQLQSLEDNEAENGKIVRLEK